ncbi:hypothetical protein AQB9606_03084 [Aquabacterium sp. CECT 9606]|nr:hypothetical protein AQB9606_03084 [Aquabacterium sp. CECT 9606]
MWWFCKADEVNAFGDAGYQGGAKRPDAKPEVQWQIAMRPGLRALDKDSPQGKLVDQIERVKAQIRAKVEHPFRVIIELSLNGDITRALLEPSTPQ